MSTSTTTRYGEWVAVTEDGGKWKVWLRGTDEHDIPSDDRFILIREARTASQADEVATKLKHIVSDIEKNTAYSL